MGTDRADSLQIWIALRAGCRFAKRESAQKPGGEALRRSPFFAEQPSPGHSTTVNPNPRPLSHKWEPTERIPSRFGLPFGLGCRFAKRESAQKTWKGGAPSLPTFCRTTVARPFNVINSNPRPPQPQMGTDGADSLQIWIALRAWLPPRKARKRPKTWRGGAPSLPTFCRATVARPFNAVNSNPLPPSHLICDFHKPEPS